jgi:hypothetical protein
MDVIQVPLWGWAATVAGLILLVVADLVLGSRQQREPGLREACLGTIAVVALAVLFGTALAWTGHPAAAGQFFAGWLTEYRVRRSPDWSGARPAYRDRPLAGHHRRGDHHRDRDQSPSYQPTRQGQGRGGC